MSRQGLAVIAFALGFVMAPLCWVMTTSVTTPAVAQEGGIEDLIDIQPEERQPKVKYKPRQERLAEEQPAADRPNLVADYLDLAKQKAELLTPEELAHETQALRRELWELQATLKLRKAEQQLQQLIDEHPESNAAQRAKTLLDGLRNSRSNSTFESRELSPEREDELGPVQKPRVRDREIFDSDPNGNNDPFTAPPVRQNTPSARPNLKPAPSLSPNRS